MGIEKIILITVICIFTAVICKILDGKAAEFGIVLKIAAAAGIMLTVILSVAPAIESISELYERTGISEEYIIILVKSLGICYLTQLASDICRDSGENAIAIQAETAGKAALIIIALPLIEKTAEFVYDLIY